MRHASPRTCPNHWRGKHRWVVPGTNMTIGDRPFGATAGAMTSAVCSRCGVSYAAAVMKRWKTLGDLAREARDAT